MPKIKILEPKYVVSFIIKFCAVTFAVFGIFGLFTIIFLDKRIGPTYMEGISALDEIKTYLPKIILITATALALTLCIVATLIALFWSKAIAGPLLRFKAHLRNIARGKLIKESLSFRNTDQLHGLAQSFSEMALSHEDKRAKSLILLVDAQKTLDQCLALKEEGKHGSEEFNLKLAALKKIYRRINDLYNGH